MSRLGALWAFGVNFRKALVQCFNKNKEKCWASGELRALILGQYF